MKISRIENTAKEAMGLAEYLYNDRTIEFVEIVGAITSVTPHTLTIWCNGSADVEVLVLGDSCKISVSLDDEQIASFSGRAWKQSFDKLGKTRHTFTFSAESSATSVRLRVTAKGGLRV